MITDIIDLSSDDDSQNDSASSLPVAVNNFERNSDEDDFTDPSTPITNGLNTSPLANKKKGGRKKGNPKSGSANSNKEERQKLKKKLAEEKQARKNANKIYKPGECMKYMTIEMHPTLLNSWYCADIQREANASGVKVKSSPTICDTALVLWTRTVMPALQNNDGFVQLTPSKVKCEHGLYILRIEDAEDMIVSHTLSQHLKQAVQLAGCKLSLVLFGVKDYFKTSGRKAARSQRLVSQIELEKAITDLLVSADCDTIVVNTPNDLALTIVQFTKAIAEEPYKKAKQALDEQADFYMRGDNKKCVAIDKDGHGLGRLWQQMLAILPHSSLETSRAICVRYKTPLELYESFQSDGLSELCDLRVSRAAVPGAKARRIGPEYANKLHAAFCSEDGAVLLD